MGSLSFEEVAKDLASFGLTGNQARVYVALTQLRIAPVSKIAQLSKIRREEIYRMMPKLEKLGLVEKALGKPIKYRSIPPKRALSILLEHEQEKANKKIAELTQMQKRLFEQLKSVEVDKEVEEEPRFVLISDRDQALRKIVEVLQKAKKEFSIVSSDYDFRFGYAYIADVFRKVLGNGVKARIVLEVNEIDAMTMKMLSEVEVFKDVAEVKHAGNLTSHMIIVDNTEILVGTFLRPTEEKHFDLWTDSPAYVDAMKMFFDRIWQDSVDIESRIEYLQTGKLIERTEVIKGRDAIYERGYAVYSRAETDKFTMTDSSGVKLSLRDFSSNNIELKKKGVRVRYLTQITNQNLELVEEMSKQFEVRHIDNLPFRCLLTETEAMFSWIPVKDMPEAAIYSNSPEMVRMMWVMAKNAWDNGVDAQSKIDEIRKGKPIARVSKPIEDYI